MSLRSTAGYSRSKRLVNVTRLYSLGNAILDTPAMETRPVSTDNKGNNQDILFLCSFLLFFSPVGIIPLCRLLRSVCRGSVIGQRFEAELDTNLIRLFQAQTLFHIPRCSC